MKRRDAEKTESPVERALAELRRVGSERNRAGMARYGIKTENAFGVPVAHLRKIARALGRDHALAGALWATGKHEARILATMVEEPDEVTPRQMDAWTRAFDSWDVCDQACNNLFVRTPHAWAKVLAWAKRDGEFVRRAGFALMASLAVHDKAAPDERFEACFAAIVEGASDERNFAAKAVNWALRQIGKRNGRLHERALETAQALAASEARAPRRAGDLALRELTSEKVARRLTLARRGR
jgi:3-methyladenine DNA glycosylase AlkD